MKDYVEMADAVVERVESAGLVPTGELVMRYALVLALADIADELAEIKDWLHSIRDDGVGVG